jgi:hypothetical protein
VFQALSAELVILCPFWTTPVSLGQSGKENNTVRQKEIKLGHGSSDSALSSIPKINKNKMKVNLLRRQRLRGSRFKVSLSKKLARAQFNKQCMHGVSSL